MTKKLSPAQERALGKMRERKFNDGWIDHYVLGEGVATLNVLWRLGLIERRYSVWRREYRAKGD